MRTFWSVTIAVIFMALHLSAEPTHITFPSDVDWVTQSSEHFDVLFRRGHDALASRALGAAERARGLLLPIFAQAPERTWVVLADFSDNLNGYALNILYPHMVIFVSSPGPSGELAALDDWLFSVILHEYTHNLHLFPAQGLWRPVRTLFGSVIAPNGLLPSHLHEGLAVFTETHFTGGGRGRSPYFSMLRRMAVHENVWGTKRFLSIDEMDGAANRWPMGVTSYFMGYQLYQSLWEKKQAPGIRTLIDTTSRTFPYFINYPFIQTFGENLDSLWQQVFEQTQKVEQEQIAQIKASALSNTQAITRTGFNKWDLHLSPQKNIAAFRSYHPETGTLLEFWDVSQKTQVRFLDENIAGVEGICFDPTGSHVLFASQSQSRGYVTGALQLYDWEKHTVSNLSDSPRNVKTVACSESLNTLIVYREHAAQGEVVRYRLDIPSKRLTRLDGWKIPDGTWVSGVSVFDETTWIAVRRNGNTDFYRWAGTEPTRVHTTPGHYHGLRPLDTDSFLAIGPADGRDEIWIIDPVRKTLQKHAGFLGGVRSFDWKAHQLLALNYHHGGFDLEWVSALAVPSRAMPSAQLNGAYSAPDTIVASTHEYLALRTLVPRAWIPLLLFVPRGVQAGLWIPGFDISQRHYYDLIGGFDSRGATFGNANYAYRFNQNQILSSVSYLPSYMLLNDDLFLFSRSALQLGYERPLGDVAVRGTTVFSKLFDSRDGATLESVGGGITLNYGFGFRPKPLDISPTRGTNLSLSGHYYPKFMGSTEEYYTVLGTLDQHIPFFFSRHSFFVGLRGATTRGTQLRNSFFEVGGEILLAPFRPTFLNRGLLPARLAARQVISANLEYRFPIVQVERGHGLWPLKLRRVHAALVTDLSTVDMDPSLTVRDQLGRVYYASSGIELKSDWIFSYYLPSRVRMGLYHGWSPLGEPLYFSMAVDASL